MSIIYPLVQEGEPEFQLSEANFAELDRVGGVTLSAELRQRLGDLAYFWVTHLRKRQSASEAVSQAAETHRGAA